MDHTPLTLFRRVRNSAARNPDRTAVVAGSQTVSYADLLCSAAGLARRLEGSGIGPGTICGLHLARSVDAVVAMLATSAVGAAWLPLDPAYPLERLRLMAQDADIRVLVTQADQPSLGLGPEVEVILASERLRATAEQVDRADAADLAYVIHTSGSTGRPKGVMIEQSSLLVALDALQRLFDIGPEDRLLSISTPNFDLLLCDVFLALIAGAEVVLASNEEARDGRRLIALLETCRPTLLQATPSTFKLLLASGWQGSRSLTVGCGGEAMPLPLAEELHARTGALWNLYGQTETTIWATAKKVEESDVAAGRISIGRALPHVRTLVLDEEGQPADTGELLILGPGVGKGYQGDPVRTSASFIDHPAGRAYRTGDLVRRLPNGEMELHGRIDHQIKIRGHRIEPGEVEAALRAHEAVQDVVVVARPDEARELRLIAYIVPTDVVDAPGLASQLHTLATRRLPAAACPQHYQMVDVLPLTASGKIDRAALPEPRRARPSLATPLMPPNDALELRLTQIVGDVLGVDAVGLDDDFFELGGDSLAAVRLLLQIEEHFTAELRLEAFLDQPTARALASALRDESNHHPALPVVALRAQGQGNPVFFVHGAGGLAFTTYEVGRAMASDRPVFVLQDPATNLDVTPTQSVQALAGAHLRSLREIQGQGPYTIIGHSFGGLLAYEMAVQLRADGDEVAFLGMLDTPIPPLATAPATLPERLAIWLREAHFTWQILAQAGPMALDGLYVMFGAEARYRERSSSRLSWTERMRATWARAVFHLLQRKAGLAFAVDPASRLLMLRQPGIRRSIQLTGVHEGARRRYVPGHYDEEVHLFRARQSSAETLGFGADHALGWRDFASEVTVHWCQGSHFTMTRGENAKQLAALLDRALIDGPPMMAPNRHSRLNERSHRPQPNASALESA